MRRLTLISLTVLTSAGLLASCATTDIPQERSPKAQAELARLIDGRVAGRPQQCLPNFRTQDMTIIDENTIIYRDGANRVWRNDLRGSCTGLGRPGNFLLTKQFGGSSLCSGEIAQVVDASGGFIVGSCSLGDFVPYTGAARQRS